MSDGTRDSDQITGYFGHGPFIFYVDLIGKNIF